MFNLIELYKKLNPLKIIQVFKSAPHREFEPLGKCSDTSIDIWNLIFISHKYYSKQLSHTANITKGARQSSSLPEYFSHQAQKHSVETSSPVANTMKREIFYYRSYLTNTITLISVAQFFHPSPMVYFAKYKILHNFAL